MSGSGGWIGIDLDGTLAHYGKWIGPAVIGLPIKPVVALVKRLRKEGTEVRIFTARIYPINACCYADEMVTFQPMDNRGRDALASLRAIQDWSKANLGEVLPVTNIKDYGMITLYDDRCCQVQTNTGMVASVDYWEEP